MKQSILVTGSGGLVATRFTKDFSEKYNIEPVDISNPSNPVDITNPSAVMTTFADSDALSVLHFAAYTDVTSAWEQKDDKDGLAYKVNVDGTKNIVDACRETGKHLVHISTAYVFDGNKDSMYTEEDPTNPIEWYGYTKAKAEEVVQESGIDWSILRIDQPFRTDSFVKTDIAHRIIKGLESGSLYPQFSNHYFGPTFLNDFSKVLDAAVSGRLTGLFHATSGEKWSDYDFALAIKEALNLGGDVKEGNLDEYLRTLDRPYQRNTALDITKLKTATEIEFTPIKKALTLLEI